VLRWSPRLLSIKVIARASVARSPARMPRTRSEGGRVREAIGVPSAEIRTYHRSGEAPDHLHSLPRVGGARKCDQFLTRCDPAIRLVHLPAVALARGEVSIVLVNRCDLIDAFGKFVSDRVFHDVWPLDRRALDDKGATLEPMHRKDGDVGHAAAGM